MASGGLDRYHATSAAAAANEFLTLGWAEPDVPPIDQMKLQKLLFYAHAWHLALRDIPLFDEDVEAWPWGPVVRDVYVQTRRFGRGPVARRLSAVQWDPDDPRKSRFIFPNVEDEPTKAFIREAWDVHKPYSGIQLSNSTHEPGEPWTIIRDQYRSLAAKPTIPNDLIRQVYKKKRTDAATGA